jgi:hypothetical protein
MANGSPVSHLATALRRRARIGARLAGAAGLPFCPVVASGHGGVALTSDSAPAAWRT